jgi:hypothetical protein
MKNSRILTVVKVSSSLSGKLPEDEASEANERYTSSDTHSDDRTGTDSFILSVRIASIAG